MREVGSSCPGMSIDVSFFSIVIQIIFRAVYEPGITLGEMQSIYVGCCWSTETPWRPYTSHPRKLHGISDVV